MRGGLENRQIMNKRILFGTCRFAVFKNLIIKNLIAVDCTSYFEYNNNFPNFSKISELKRKYISLQRK